MKSNKLIALFLITFVILLISCNRKVEIQTGNYYFPVNDLFKGKTYTYINKNDTTEKAYFKIITYIVNTDTILQTIILDNNHRITDSIVEKITKGNSKFISYTLYDYIDEDLTLNTESEIIDSSIFKTNQNIGESIKWKIRYRNHFLKSICEQSKERTLINKDKNKITFKDKMKIEDIEKKNELKYEVVMVYQKDIGLISYKELLPERVIKDFVLVDRK